VLVVTLDRPEVRNAVDGPTAEALLDAWTTLRDDDELRAGVLAGAGKAFCAGADLDRLDTLGPGPDADEAQREAFLEGPEGYLGPTRGLDPGKPVLAAVDGPARAGGVELALLADLRVAGEGASFGFTNREADVPLVDGGTQRLPRIVGLGRALELILTGEVVGAQRAAEIGLVNELVPEGTALDRALELATRIAELPQASLLADRDSVYAGLGRSPAAGLAREARRGQRAIDREGFEERARALLDER
jgi:enoyl-CoA hydratase